MADKSFYLAEGEQVTIEITGLTHGGEGVGRYQGIPVFVPFTVPGDQAVAVITAVKKHYARGRLKMLAAGSPLRRDPVCPAFSRCGGCALQQMDYAAQLRQKTALVKDSLARIGRLPAEMVKETIGMAHPWHYRNKVSYQVGQAEGRLFLGFYEKGSHRLAAEEAGVGTPAGQEGQGPGCLLVDEDLNRIAAVLETLLNQFRVAAYDRRRRRGLLRQVMLRKACATGECMAVLVTTPGDWPAEKAFAAALTEQLPELRSVLRQITPSPAPGRRAPSPGGAGAGAAEKVLAGRAWITDYIGNLAFRISAASFYQVNPYQTPVLYEQALAYAGLSGAETVVDAYSGTGTIALYLAGRSKMVYGLEVVPAAVEDAKSNAVLNQINNVDFQLGAVEKLLPALAAQGHHPDVVVLDPPRRGCDAAVLDAVAAMRTPRVVYVSCDPGTLARDLRHLAGKGYRVAEVQPVDMFPWTAHVECVVLMSRVKE